MSRADALERAQALHQAGRLPEACEHYRAVLAERPGEAAVLHAYGLALFQLGELEAAARRLAEAVAAAPGDVEARANLGNVLLVAGDTAGAAAAYREVLARRPGHVQARANLGNALQSLGDLEGAVAAYREAAAAAPGIAGVHNNLASALRALGDLDGALAAARRAIEIAPDYAQAHNNLANVLEQAGDPEAAQPHYRRAVTLQPGFVEAWNNLANLLQRTGAREEAVAAYERALELRPDFAEGWNNLGNVLRDAGDARAAADHYRRALRIDPDYAQAHGNLGNALRDLGRLAEAAAAYERALARQPDFAEARRHLADLKGWTGGTPAPGAIAELLAGAPDAEAETELCFALAREHELAGDLDAAFEAFERANRLHRQASDYDVADDEARARAITEVIDAAAIEALSAGEGEGGEAAVFVIGMPRSGSTLLEQILASHPAAAGAGELGAFPALLGALEREHGEPYPGMVHRLDRRAAGALARDYLAALRAHGPNARRVVDKLLGNFFFVGLLHALLPGARFINCLRDPLDNCLACYTQRFTVRHEFAYAFDDLARYYRLYQRLMAHWRALLPARILDLRYEDLVADPEGQVRRVLAFLELPWDRRCLDFHRTQRIVQSASAAQVRQPLYSGAVGRARRYGERLAPLAAALEHAGVTGHAS